MYALRKKKHHSRKPWKNYLFTAAISENMMACEGNIRLQGLLDQIAKQTQKYAENNNNA